MQSLRDCLQAPPKERRPYDRTRRKQRNQSTPGHSSFTANVNNHENQTMKTTISKTGFEQEQTERTENGKANSLWPIPMAIRRPFILVVSSLESALCSLCFLLFKPIWWRFLFVRFVF